jgi:hypothetical protein
LTEALRFPVFILASLVAFFAILSFVTRKRSVKPSLALLAGIAGAVVVGGMVFAKLGQNAGWHWGVYYTVPALVTLLVPALALRFSPAELWRYLVLAALSSPVIHVLFSVLLGWHDYMPFIRIPLLQEILSSGQTGI